MSSRSERPAWSRAALVLLMTIGVFASAATALAQGAASMRFVLGPLQWTPTLQLRETGTDSNVFNTPEDAKQDIRASVVPQVDSLLTLGIMKAATLGSVEYAYFDKYKNERALNGRVATRMTFPLNRIQPTANFSWARVKERATTEIDVRAPRTDHGYGVGLTTKLTSRLALITDIARQSVLYDSGSSFRGVDLATQLNRQATTATVGVRVAASPLTAIFIDGSVGRDEFELQSSHNTDNVRGNLGVEFAPDAVIRGRAQVGYHKMQPQHASSTPGGALAFSGVTSTVDVSYTLLGRTQFTPRFSRDSSYSISTSQPYYVSMIRSLDILQTLFGPLDLVARGSREGLAYPATDLFAARTDRVETVGGGLSVRLSTQGRISINYDDNKRRSSAGPLFGYARRRIYTTITYGF
jgi:hypothetical protein